jgi:hypothetical protein
METRKEFAREMVHLLAKPIRRGFSKLYKETRAENKVPRLILREFQTAIKRYAITAESAPTDAPGAQALARRIARLHLHLTGNKIDADTILQACLLEVAREVWRRPFMFYHGASKMEQQQNLGEFDKLVKVAIKSVVFAYIPLVPFVDALGDDEFDDEEEQQDPTEAEEEQQHDPHEAEEQQDPTEAEEEQQDPTEAEEQPDQTQDIKDSLEAHSTPQQDAEQVPEPEHKQDADDSKQDADDSKQDADDSKQDADDSKQDADDSKQDADDSKQDADDLEETEDSETYTEDSEQDCEQGTKDVDNSLQEPTQESDHEEEGELEWDKIREFEEALGDDVDIDIDALSRRPAPLTKVLSDNIKIIEINKDAELLKKYTDNEFF